MKYQSLSAFEQHIERSTQTGLSRVFLVVTSCPYERKKVAEFVMQKISSREEDTTFSHQEAIEGSVKRVLEDLNTCSFFAQAKVIHLSGIESLKKGDLELLTAYVERPSEIGYLILSASSSKGLSDLYLKGKKELIACDLSGEKPWELKKRLKSFVARQITLSSKKIEERALEALLEKVGLFLPDLEQEVDKLITYVGQREVITLSDVDLLVSSRKELQLFELGSSILFESKAQPNAQQGTIDPSLLFPLLSLLKNQLQNSLAIAHLLSQKKNPEDIRSYLGLKPFQFEKLAARASSLPRSFFKKGMTLLFELELLAKNSSFDPSLLIDLLTSKFLLLKKLELIR